MPILHSDNHMADAPQAPLNARTNHVFMQIHTIDGVISSNQTIPVLKITATDRILDATARLIAAIEGVQEAPPDELAAIQALRTLLLGEVPPPEPTPAPVTAPHPTVDEEPVEIWNPDEVQHPARDTGTNSPASTPLSRQNLPAIIEDESDNNTVPPTLLRRSPQAHTAPSTTNAHIRLHAT